jgi:hypothetical protein
LSVGTYASYTALRPPGESIHDDPAQSVPETHRNRRGGLATLGAASGTATATHSPPYVSTRDHFDDSANLVSGETTFSYDTSGTVPGVDTDCVYDLTVFIHGWSKKDDGDAEQNAYEKITHAGHGLYNNGYWGNVIGFTWDSDKGGGGDYGWGEAQDIAQQNGYKLAQFAVDFKYYCPDATLRFESHSLGAQVLLSCLRVLDNSSWWTDNGHQIESTHLLGAAQDNEAPTLEWPDTYYAIRDRTRATFNYYSQDDSVLAWIYNTYEFDQALGETGAESGNTPAPNYTDFDATSQVGNDHSSYIDNCSDEIVYHMRYIDYYD